MIIQQQQTNKITENNLYDRDFYLWVEKTVKQLKEKEFKELDLANLIEEIEDMGKQAKHSLKSNLIIVLMHLLKYQYQPQKKTRSWLLSIYEHRRRINESLQDSPSLKNYYEEVFDQCYQNARKEASIETGLKLNIFPETCTFTLPETLDPEFLPE